MIRKSNAAIVAGLIVVCAPAHGLSANGARLFHMQDAAAEAPPALEADAAPVNEDEMADLLNSRQQIRQSVTLVRELDGKVVETREKVIVFDRDDPIRSGEARRSRLEMLKMEFNRQLLTRTEAFEEAKLYFTLADLDRDGAMNASEFIRLVEIWRDNDERNAETASPEVQRQLRYVDFVDDLDPYAARERAALDARRKFEFMAGAATTLSQADYIREYLTEFDAEDVEGSGTLSGDALMRFRAANRGRDLSGQ